MPQLDKLSFISQYIWLTFFFFFLYFIVLNFFIINIYQYLKLRNLINYITWYRLNKVDYNKGLFVVINNMRYLYFGKVNSIIFKKTSLFFKKNMSYNSIKNKLNFNFLFFSINLFNQNKIFLNINKIKIDEF